MEISIDNYFEKRYMLFKWRSNASLANKAVMALFMACITGIMAQVIIPLPWTPVPVTGQTFAVLVAGIFLGRKWGGFSQLFYVGIGVAGVPWFAGMTGGAGTLLSASGGYLIGFVLAAFFLGYFADRYVKARNFIPMLALMLFANFALIYIPGLAVLSIWTQAATGAQPSIWTLLVMGVLPFLPGEVVKIGGAAALAKAVTPKKPFTGGEIDVERAENLF